MEQSIPLFMQCLSNCIWFPLRERNVSYLQSNCKLLWGRLYYLYLNCERHYLQLCFHLSFCFVCKVNNSSPYFRIKETVAPDHRDFFFFFCHYKNRILRRVIICISTCEVIISFGRRVSDFFNVLIHHWRLAVCFFLMIFSNHLLC